MVKKLIINADDLGFSLGFNLAILKANKEGYLSHASLMANTKYFQHAIDEVIPKSTLKIGVHANLTCGNALFKENVLADDGKQDKNFVQLLFKWKSKKVLESIEKELELQIIKIKNAGIEISHIDGNEHVHIIPSINKIVRKLAQKHNIPRIREINENIFESWKYNRETAKISTVIKLLLLRFLSLFNENDKKIGFYSMLNTCEIDGKNLFPFLKNSKRFDTLEVMLHPAYVDLDSAYYSQEINPRYLDFLTSSHRVSELELCFDKNFEKYEIAN